MTPDQEKTWKAISKTELTLGNAIKSHLFEPSDAEQKMIDDLQDKLDDTFELHDVKTVMNPHTFEPITIARIIRTEKK